MCFHYPLPAYKLEPGECLKYVVGGIHEILQEEFGKRNTEIFWRHDSGIKTRELADDYNLTTSRIRQIVSIITRYLDKCFSLGRLRILPLIHMIQSKEDEIKQILLSAGYTIDAIPEATITKTVEQIVLPKKYKTELDKLNLNSRCVTILNRRAINTVEDLCNLTIKELCNLRGIGAKLQVHVQLKLAELGLSLKQ